MSSVEVTLSWVFPRTDLDFHYESNLLVRTICKMCQPALDLNTRDSHSWTSPQPDADAGHHADDHLEPDADAVAHLRVQVPGAESPDQLGIPTLSLFFPIVLLVIIILKAHYFSVVRHAKCCEELCVTFAPKKFLK